jgi:hypothetical protein
MPGDPQTDRPEATLTEFFEVKPLSVVFKIVGVNLPEPPGAVRVPLISLWCQGCDGLRTFEADDILRYSEETRGLDKFIGFVCRNCRLFVKKYAIYQIGCDRESVGLGNRLLQFTCVSPIGWVA